MLVGGQDHFYLEGQVAYAIPGEVGDMLVHSTTQHPTEEQHSVAKLHSLLGWAPTISLEDNLERIIAAPSAMRRSASPRLVAPHTNGTVKFHLSMWLA